MLEDMGEGGGVEGGTCIAMNGRGKGLIAMNGSRIF